MVQPHRDLVFVSYSRHDRKWLDRLQVFCKPFERNGQFTVWADPHIKVGDRWERKIEEALARTKVAVLLASPSFLASDFIYDNELPALFRAADRGDVRLFPIPVSAAPFEADVRLKEIQWVRDPDQPLDELAKSERNRALKDIVLDLVQIFGEPLGTEYDAQEAKASRVTRGVAQRPRSVSVELDQEYAELHAVPPQCPHFIPYAEDLDILLDVLFSDRPQVVGVTGAARSGPAHRVGLHGMGGIGKSVLAIAFVNDDRVRRSFPDGVFWLSLGQSPDLPALQSRLARQLGIGTAGFRTIEEGRGTLSEALSDRRALVVLDDVWDVSHARAFGVSGPRSRLLVTTRDAAILTALDAFEHRLDVLSADHAQRLLEEWTGSEPGTLPSAASRVAEECGYLPLALSVAGALVRDGAPWADVAEALAAGRLEFLDHPYENVFNSLRLSVDRLPQSERDRYLELSVFPEDVRIPETTVLRLWGHTGGLVAFEGRALLRRLAARGLLYVGPEDGEAAGVRLHDLQHDYVRLRADDPPGLHRACLEAYARGLAGEPQDGIPPWSSLEPDEPYVWDHLFHHLEQAGAFSDMALVAQDLRYLVARSFASGPTGAGRDLERTVELFPEDAELAELRRRFTQLAHLLADLPTLSDVAVTLRSRVIHDPVLTEKADPLLRLLDGPVLTPRWPFPDRPAPGLVRTLEGHQGRVRCCTVDSEGAWIVSGGADRTVRVWDAATGEEVRTLQGHEGWVRCCASVPGRRWIVSGGDDRTVRVWDAETGEQVRTLEGHEGWVLCCAVDPGSRWIVSGGEDGTLRVWDLESGLVKRTLRGHEGWVLCCAVDPGGRWVVSGSVDRTVRVWDPETGEAVRMLGTHDEWVRCCAVDPGRRWVVSGDDAGTLRTWDAETGEALWTLEDHRGSVRCCAVDSAGRRIVVGRDDGTLQMWDPKAGAMRTAEGHGGSVLCCAVDPRGRWIVSGAADRTVRVWSAQAGEASRALGDEKGWVRCCAVDPEERWIVSGGTDCLVWNADTGKALRTLEGHAGWVECCAVDPAGRWIVSGSRYDRTLRMWDAETGRLVWTLEGHERGVLCCAMDPRGRWIVSGGEDGTLRVWDTETGRAVRALRGHEGWVQCCAVDPGGRWIVSGSADRTVRVWAAETGTLARTLTLESSMEVRCCAVDPGGRWVVSGGNDRMLRVWDAETGETLRTLVGHDDEVRCCAVDPRGRWIVSGAADRTLRLWDTEAGMLRRTLRVDGPLMGCDWRGSTIAAAGPRGLYVFDLRE